MATIRVYKKDQENRIHDHPRGRGKENLVTGASTQQQQQTKRAVLGVLQLPNNNCQKLNTKSKEINKDEKYARTKSYKTQYEYNYESKKEESVFKVYEDKKDKSNNKFPPIFKPPVFTIYEDVCVTELEEAASVALRNSNEENEIVYEKQTTTEKSDKDQENLKVENAVDATSNCNLAAIHSSLDDICQGKSQDDSYLKDNYKDSPMSVGTSLEKSLTYSSSSNEEYRTRRASFKEMRNSFFEVDEYRNDIHNYLRVAETLHRPKSGYMKKQPDITYSMRSILIDWLVEVAEEYRLQDETLYLTVSYIDRFLSYMSVVRTKLQLVGTAAMFIAAKYEEIYPPDVGEFVYITDDTYTKMQVIKMENLILRVLSFDLTVPTHLTFIQDYCVNNNFSDRIKFLAMYLCELSMLEGDPYLQFVPSHLAASALALARHTLQEEIWPHELELSTGYSLKTLKECIAYLNKTFHKAPTNEQQAIREKYKKSKYGHVSLLLPRSTEAVSDEDEEESA